MLKLYWGIGEYEKAFISEEKGSPKGGGSTERPAASTGSSHRQHVPP
jgi:hypothetical protein